MSLLLLIRETDNAKRGPRGQTESSNPLATSICRLSQKVKIAEGDYVEGAISDMMDASNEDPANVLARFVLGRSRAVEELASEAEWITMGWKGLVRPCYSSPLQRRSADERCRRAKGKGSLQVEHQC